MDQGAVDWLAARTFDAGLLTGDQILDRKGSTRISVVIPARNEARTLGRILTQIRQELMIGQPLVDELVVIDSDSTDETATLAKQAGATVHAAAQIRPDLGWQPGKGEAMWKSLFVCTGDLIVFVDGDLTSFRVEYVTGLVGPLLAQPKVQLVKAFYRRDLAVAGMAQPGNDQGGRVTELMARPLINLWWPALAGVVQPLAGEWAVRRELLESLPIPCGYGVEFTVLVDTYERLGLDAIAQVDLGVRAHVHQDLASLGVMAAEILAAATSRRFAEQSPGTTMGFAQLGEGRIMDRPINARERPAYRSLTTAT